MKLTEKQLAEIFKNTRNTTATCNTDDLFLSADASKKRLAAVENITNSNHLSASFHIINQLNEWSGHVGNDLQADSQRRPSIKSMFTDNLLSWLKPSLATAAMVTCLYFITPQLTHDINKQQADRIFISTSFESNKEDVIQSLSFDQSQTQFKDTISKTNFG